MFILGVPSCHVLLLSLYPHPKTPTVARCRPGNLSVMLQGPPCSMVTKFCSLQIKFISGENPDLGLMKLPLLFRNAASMPHRTVCLWMSIRPTEIDIQQLHKTSFTSIFILLASSKQPPCRRGRRTRSLPLACMVQLPPAFPNTDQ